MCPRTIHAFLYIAIIFLTPDVDDSILQIERTADFPDDKIDVVYMWLNDSHSEYAALRRKWEPTSQRVYSPSMDHGELVVSIRSLFRFGAPWLGRIFILSNLGITPDWISRSALDERRVVIIDSDKAVGALGGVTPCFNSHAIVSTFHSIPGLRERFIAMDDDFILVRPTQTTDFFVGEHEVFPKTIVPRRCTDKAPDLRAQCNATRKIMNVSSYWSSHTARPFRKSHLRDMEQTVSRKF